jgi:hypothetical protein
MLNLVVEGDSDREAAKAVVRWAGRDTNKVVVAGGKTRLDPKIEKYNRAAGHASWVVFRDSDGRCPVVVRNQISSQIVSWSPRFALRIAHSMTEAWLLADRDGFAEYFGVATNLLSRDPESLPHAKREVLRLCARSRSRAIRQDMVASDGDTGPLYVSRINDFASSRWDVGAAADVSQSLHRTVDRVRSLP